jgi:hypothetical protein
MNLSVDQLKSLSVVVDPLAQWLRNNGHPHITVIVNGDSVEVMETLALCKIQAGLENPSTIQPDNNQEIQHGC